MKICPALGDLEDDELQYAYPSDENHCHKAEPVGPVNLVYQSSVCLSENYRRCPVFRGRLSGPLPEGFRAEGQVSGGLELRKILLWAGLMLVALLGLGLNIAFPDLAAGVLSNANASQTVTLSAGPRVPDRDGCARNFPAGCSAGDRRTRRGENVERHRNSGCCQPYPGAGPECRFNPASVYCHCPANRQPGGCQLNGCQLNSYQFANCQLQTAGWLGGLYCAGRRQPVLPGLVDGCNRAGD